jgi:choline dehydrogenase-like flavoprotein
MIADASELAPGSEISADICIIGSGAAGVTLALKLLGTGKRILLLESSARDISWRTIETHARIMQNHGADPQQFSFAQDKRNYDSVAQALNEGAESAELASLDPRFLQWSRLRAYGGTTNAWGGWTRPLEAIDFDRSDLDPSVAWPISREAIYPRYYNEAMHLCSMPGIAVERYDDEAFWPKHVKDIRFLNLGETTGGAMRNAVFLVMNSAALDFQTVWGPMLESAPNCRILRNANVRVVVGNAANRSVDHLIASTIVDRKHGGDFTVKAGQYVVATGGTEVARLLLHSAPDGFANTHDWLGRCFQIHPLNASFAGYTQGSRLPPEQVINLYSRVSEVPIGKMPPSLFAALAPTEDTLRRSKLRNHRVIVDLHSRNINLNWEQAPNADSRVRLSKTRTDPFFGDPLADLDWQPLPVDTAGTPAKALGLIADTLCALGYANRVTRTGPVMTGAGDHHIGATRMSARPEDGFVDIHCRVHGVDNLYIAGSSVFPTSGYANPTLTIIALAARLGDHLAGRHTWP